MTDRIVIGFSGSPSSTAALARLAGEGSVEVVAVTLALGQGRELEGIQDRALAAGAVRCHVLDVEERFARELVWPAVRAGVDLMLQPATLIAPLLGRALAEMAAVERAATVAHAASGRVARQIEASIGAADPTLTVLAAGDSTSDVASLTALLDDRELRAPGESPLQVSSSLWGRRVTGSALADPSLELPPEAFLLTRGPRQCPDDPASLELRFERGVPLAVNGIGLPLVELMASVDTIAGAHGIGRHDLAGLDSTGRTWRELRESPALTTLGLAHAALTAACSTVEDSRLRRRLSDQYAELLQEGRWQTAARRAVEAAVDATQACVTGVVRLSLYKGHATLVSRRADDYDRSPVLVSTGDSDREIL